MSLAAVPVLAGACADSRIFISVRPGCLAALLVPVRLNDYGIAQSIEFFDIRCT